MRIVSFARAIPYRAIPHAGGAYLHSHLKLLSESNEITLVVPGTIRNTGDIAKLDLALHLYVAPRSKSFISRLRSRLTEELCPVIAPVSIAKALRNDLRLREVVASADIVEFQWSEYASLAKAVRRINPTALFVCISHDVLRQKYWRRLKSSNTVMAFLRSLFGWMSSLVFEAKNLQRMDRVLVFSDKDKSLVGPSVSDKTSVINPPIEATSTVGSKCRSRVLFTGALSRPENDEGILWFIQNCWDKVIASVPSATLVVAGANPTPRLAQIVSEIEEITLTGFLEDLDSVYPTATVFVNPVMSGAGVKFKTITAMLYGVPVVSTQVGAEGIGSEDLYVSVTDDPRRFAEAVIFALTNPQLVDRLSEATRQWASGEYGIERFRDALTPIYKVRGDGFENA